MAKSSKSKKGTGLRPKTFNGMNKKRFGQQASGGFRNRLPLKKGTTRSVMFLHKPDPDSEHYEEYDVHAFQENGRWKFVPCAEDGCPLCDADDEKMRRTSYRFCTNVYDLETKKVMILEGGSNLATVIHAKFARKPAKFLKRCWDLTMFPTQPVTFGCDISEEDAVPSSVLNKVKEHDLLEYIMGEMKAYYGEDLDNVDLSRTSLDDDDDDEDEDDEYDEDDEEDEDDEDEEDEDEDDELVRKKSKKSSKKTSSKKSKRR